MHTFAEPEIENQRAILASIVDYSDDAIFSSDLNGIIGSWNIAAEKIFGYSSEEVLERHISMIIPSRHFYEESEIKKKIKLGEKVNRFETQLRKKKKDCLIDVSLTVSPVKDSNSIIIGASIIARDISERKKAEKLQAKLMNELERNNNEIESFTYSVSHDLRAPLRIIDGFASVLKKNHIKNLGEEGKELIELIINNAKKMELLIEDLLAFSHIGKKELTKSTIDSQLLAETILQEMHKTIQMYKPTIFVENLLPMIGDPSLIRQVFFNLISNAIKYSRNKENPTITIGSYNKCDENIFYVKDNGIGFDMRFYQRLFKVFQRLVTSTEFEGTGLGLAIVEKIISKHNGRVWAKGKPGEGSVFYFSLPAR